MLFIGTERIRPVMVEVDGTQSPLLVDNGDEECGLYGNRRRGAENRAFEIVRVVGASIGTPLLYDGRGLPRTRGPCSLEELRGRPGGRADHETISLLTLLLLHQE